ncbi:zf-HC2 domain-containing protein [Streptomyces sp. NPDC048254]|uniref:zf-HC2 domain-containing protein n=1 Tax=Streptomyces sp. NPDC048254 TaxID=3365525 RepID=UPI0037151C5F
MTDRAPTTHPRRHPTRAADHLPDRWVADYAQGRLGQDLLGHAEAHLHHCPPCARRVDTAVRQGQDGPRLDAVLATLLSRLPEPGGATDPPPPVSRWTEPPPWLSGAKGLRLPWLLATLTVSGTTLALAQLRDIALPLLLLLAPLLPLLCVAASYGGRADPFAEVTRTTPAGGLRLLLSRTGQVLVLCVPLLSGAGFVLAQNGSQRDPVTMSAVAWLLPCLALTVATLLLSTYLGSRPAAATTGGGWLLLVAAVAQLDEDNKLSHRLDPASVSDALAELLGQSAQCVWAIAAAVLTQLLYLNRHSFDRPGTR